MDKRSQEIADLKKQLGELTDRITKAADNTVNEAGENLADHIMATKEKVQDMAADAQEKFHVATQQAKKGAKKADEFVHNNPWVMAVGAVAIGVLVGLALNHRQND